AVPGPGHQSGVHLVQSAGVAEQDQRGRRGCGSGRPQDARDLAEGKFAFEDTVVEALLGSEFHGRALSGVLAKRRSRQTYRRTVTPEGSTHVETFTGTTSSVSRTVSGKLAVVAAIHQTGFAGARGPAAKAVTLSQQDPTDS